MDGGVRDFTQLLVFKQRLAEQVKAGEKDVTRRLIREKTRGWREGAYSRLYDKRPEFGGKPFGEALIISARREALEAVTREDVAREGFEGMTRSGFVREFLKFYDLASSSGVRVWRVEFKVVTLYDCD